MAPRLTALAFAVLGSIGIAAPAATATATTPPGPGPDPAVQLSSDELSTIWAHSKAPNSLCAMMGTYYQVTFSDGGAADDAESKARFVQASPALAALVDDAAANPPTELPPEYDVALERWAALFSTVVGEMRAGGLDDRQIKDLALAAPRQLPASVDQAAIDSAIAAVGVNPDTEFNLIRQGVNNLDDFDAEDTCSNLQELTLTIDMTNPRLANKLTDSPNSVCSFALMSVVQAFSLLDNLEDPARQREVTVALSPMLLALANDVLANPPAGLPASFAAAMPHAISLLSPIVDDLTGQGLDDAALGRLWVIAMNEPGEGAADLVPVADRTAVAAVAAAAPADLPQAYNSILQSLDSDVDNTYVTTTCPNLAGLVSGPGDGSSQGGGDGQGSVEATTPATTG